MSETRSRVRILNLPRPKIALVSSHLGRWPHRRHDWFAALATACSDLVPAGSTLLSAAGTTTDPYLSRCAELFGHRIETKPVSGVPRRARDRLCVEDADTVIVLSARNHSRTASLVTELTQLPARIRPVVWFARTASLVPLATAMSWETHGARPFLSRCRTPATPWTTSATTRLATVQDKRRDDWLVHCTRECDGPWPGQSREEYLDNLILGRAESDHSVQCTLRRILIEGRLRAVSRPVRGAPPAVSFTSCPLEQLGSRRVFRPHRGRWDFEPYGLAISQDWLIARGARPVVYRDHPDLSGEDPFEQPAISEGNTGIDWTGEQEWRHPGDIDLSLIPPDCGLVLVGQDMDVPAVADHSPWPIAIISRSRKDDTAIQ
ncbi:MAG: hypothetical protein VX669_17525 [Planctomycetota bacterium]|nr:hypothetical protein [Planctomycetota bacterium]